MIGAALTVIIALVTIGFQLTDPVYGTGVIGVAIRWFYLQRRSSRCSISSADENEWIENCSSKTADNIRCEMRGRPLAGQDSVHRSSAVIRAGGWRSVPSLLIAGLARYLFLP